MTFRLRCRNFGKRIRADAQKGSAAIEFAFVAPVFLVLLMGTFEAGIMFFSQSVLQNAVSEMARQIRTGQNQAVATSKDAFRTALCDKVAPLIACDGNLQIDVEAFANYGGIQFTSPLTAKQEMDPTLNNYVTGGACDVVLVRAFYTWSVATPALSWFLVNMAGDKHMIAAAAAFRNEPFDNGLAGC